MPTINSEAVDRVISVGADKLDHRTQEKISRPARTRKRSGY